MFKPPYDNTVIHSEIPSPKRSIYTIFIKRILDIVLSALAILILSPLLLLLVILQLIFQGRPVLYVDQRPGLNGEIFGIYKFRSMNDARDESGNLLHASKRITPFGRFLRKTSLDELPSLFNILNGTMSIIGPRPLMKNYLPLYSERHRYRHTVRPGLACWRVDSSNKLTSATWTWNTQFESDIYYVENSSFLLDVWMVIKTIKIVLNKSDMRANSDRIRFDGENLLESRPRHEIIQNIKPTE